MLADPVPRVSTIPISPRLHFAKNQKIRQNSDFFVKILYIPSLLSPIGGLLLSHLMNACVFWDPKGEPCLRTGEPCLNGLVLSHGIE